MIDPWHLTAYVIRPVLKSLNALDANSERMVLGTACKESECGRFLKQLDGGPALGIYQMETATHDDLWVNFLANRPTLAHTIKGWMFGHTLLNADEMMGNLYYATAMCRVFYLRVPEIIPATLHEQAEYWKRHYNTALGAGTAEEYIQAWRRFVPSGNV